MGCLRVGGPPSAHSYHFQLILASPLTTLRLDMNHYEIYSELNQSKAHPLSSEAIIIDFKDFEERGAQINHPGPFTKRVFDSCCLHLPPLLWLLHSSTILNSVHAPSHPTKNIILRGKRVRLKESEQLITYICICTWNLISLYLFHLPSFDAFAA